MEYIGNVDLSVTRDINNIRTIQYSEPELLRVNFRNFWRFFEFHVFLQMQRFSGMGRETNVAAVPYSIS